MLYVESMKPITTKQATDILGVHKYTLYDWGKKGKIKMKRDKILGYRTFDKDEIMALAKKMPKEWKKGASKIDVAKKALKK